MKLYRIFVIGVLFPHWELHLTRAMLAFNFLQRETHTCTPVHPQSAFCQSPWIFLRETCSERRSLLTANTLLFSWEGVSKAISYRWRNTKWTQTSATPSGDDINLPNVHPSDLLLLYTSGIREDQIQVNVFLTILKCLTAAKIKVQKDT